MTFLALAVKSDPFPVCGIGKKIQRHKDSVTERRTQRIGSRGRDVTGLKDLMSGAGVGIGRRGRSTSSCPRLGQITNCTFMEGRLQLREGP